METATKLELIKTETTRRPDTALILDRLKEQLLKPLPPSAQVPKFDCDVCSDLGYRSEVQSFGGRNYTGRVKCGCALAKIRANRLKAIPPRFTDARLENLKPDTSRHPQQAQIVPFIKQNPAMNYFFGGKFGTGKTLFSWSLYRAAVERDAPRVVICTLAELLTEYKQFIQSSIAGTEKKYPRIVAEDLRQTHTRYSIFLDDIDKAKPTEYAAEQFFELADAIYTHNHQLVVTTNLTVAKLVMHFEKADERFGGAIVRRILDGAKIYEMF